MPYIVFILTKMVFTKMTQKLTETFLTYVDVDFDYGLKRREALMNTKSTIKKITGQEPQEAAPGIDHGFSYAVNATVDQIEELKTSLGEGCVIVKPNKPAVKM
jgi:glutamate mutase epsilon subunit